jgi:REP element-mobilizing transposase RayT
MTFDPDRHHRRSIRLRGYDYSQAGAYFVTICAKDRTCLFGEVVDGVMVLNPIGKIVDDEWRLSATLRDEIELDEWVVMPNHVHGIVVIDGCRRDDPPRTDRRGERPVAPTTTDPDPTNDPTRTGHAPTTNGVACGPKPRSLGAFIAGFKSAATKRINELRGSPGIPVWQRNYYERIIRDDGALNRIRQYIIDNPAKWTFGRRPPCPLPHPGARGRV